MTWIVRSTHPESLHNGRIIVPGQEVVGVDPELDKGLIDRGAIFFVRSEDEPEAAATDAALILIEEHGLDAEEIKGTGKDGRVTEPDVRKVLEQASATGGDSPASTKDGGSEVAPDPAAVPQTQKEESK